MSRIAVCLIAAGLTLAAGAAQAECKYGRMEFNLGQESTMEITVKSGEYCSSALKFPNLKIDSITVPRQPKNGLVTIAKDTWKFRSFANFRGKDTFTLRITTGSGKDKRDGVLNVLVTVN